MSALARAIVAAGFFAVLAIGFYFGDDLTSGKIAFSIGTSTPMLERGDPSPAPRRTIPLGMEEYRNERFGFSILYPAQWPPQESHDEDTLTVVFEGVEDRGFTIHAAPIEGTTITEARFKNDSPSGVRKDPIDTFVGGAPGVAFDGFDAGMGDTREVWFVDVRRSTIDTQRMLFEVKTWKVREADINEILKTWQFI